jgi:hypothetical protein
MANFANIGGPNVKIMGQADLSRLIVRGRGAHIATALTNLGWSKGPAVTILRTATWKAAGMKPLEA